MPPGLLFSLGLLSSDGRGHTFPKWPPPEKYLSRTFSRALLLMSLPHNKPQLPPVLPGCPPRTAVRSDPDSHGASALPWDPVHTKTCKGLSRMGPPPPPVLWSSCAQAPLTLQGLSLPVPDHQAWGPDVGSELPLL